MSESTPKALRLHQDELLKLLIPIVIKYHKALNLSVEEIEKSLRANIKELHNDALHSLTSISRGLSAGAGSSDVDRSLGPADNPWDLGEGRSVTELQEFMGKVLADIVIAQNQKIIGAVDQADNSPYSAY